MCARYTQAQILFEALKVTVAQFNPILLYEIRLFRFCFVSTRRRRACLCATHGARLPIWRDTIIHIIGSLACFYVVAVPHAAVGYASQPDYVRGLLLFFWVAGRRVDQIDRSIARPSPRF